MLGAYPLPVNLLAEESEITLELVIPLDQLSNLGAGMHGCCMVAITNVRANRGVGTLRFLAEQVHGHLAREGEALFTALAQKLLHRHVIVPRDDL